MSQLGKVTINQCLMITCVLASASMFQPAVSSEQHDATAKNMPLTNSPLVKLAIAEAQANLGSLVSYHATLHDHEISVRNGAEAEGIKVLDQRRERELLFQDDTWKHTTRVHQRNSSEWRLVYNKIALRNDLTAVRFTPGREQNLCVIDSPTKAEWPIARDFFGGYHLFHATRLEDLLTNVESVHETTDSSGRDILKVRAIVEGEGYFDLELALNEGCLITGMVCVDAEGRRAAERTDVAVTQMGGVWLLSGYKEVIYSRKEAVPNDTREIEVVFHSVNEPLSDEQLAIDLDAFSQPTLVSDRVKGEEYVVGEAGEPGFANPGPSTNGLSKRWIVIVVINGLIALAVLAFFWLRVLRPQG